MDTILGERCDGCGKTALVGDQFFAFAMPPSFSRITGEPDGVFPGIARAGDPRVPLKMHACPVCQPKILSAISYKIHPMFNALENAMVNSFVVDRIKDLKLLPPGPLRKCLKKLDEAGRLNSVKTQ